MLRTIITTPAPTRILSPSPNLKNYTFEPIQKTAINAELP